MQSEKNRQTIPHMSSKEVTRIEGLVILRNVMALESDPRKWPGMINTYMDLGKGVFEFPPHWQINNACERLDRLFKNDELRK